MRIAVISDTHDRVPTDMPWRIADADEIWHLGDVCAPSALEIFQRLGPPVHVVLGNCDSSTVWPVSLDLERGGLRFHLVHIPPRKAPPRARVVLHGHTHVPRDETDAAGVRWLNPGCITRPNRGAAASFGWLVVNEARIEWSLMRV